MMPSNFIAAVEAAIIEGQKLPRSQAPEFIQGGFNRCEAVFTIARKGRVTPVGVSYDCTLEGDEPSPRVEVPAAPRVAILISTSGNGGQVRVSIYA